MERYVGIGWLGQLGWPMFVGRLAGLVGSNLLETHKISVFLIKKISRLNRRVEVFSRLFQDK